MKVHIDAQRCRGHALCVARVPEVFEFIDLDDRAVVRDGAPAESAVEASVRAAARECPERAIVIEEN